jgi:hypothetical protein
MVTHVLCRVSSSCSTSGIRRDGDSGILESKIVPAPLVAFVVMVTHVLCRVTSSCSTSGIRREGNSSVLEG